MQDYIERVTGGADLTIEEVRDAAWAVLKDATEAQIDALLAALRAKGETEAEIAGFVQGIHDATLTIEPDRGPPVDTRGIGGDDRDTISVSTTSTLVAAGADAAVAKHDNYSVSSSSGSVDVLEVTSINAEVKPEPVEACIEDNGVGFMFAPAFHLTMKAVIGPWKEPGMQAVFDVLGPLMNPAGANAQILGVHDVDLIPIIAESLPYIPVERTLVVHGSGMDKIALHDTATVVEIDGDEITEYILTPADLGLERASIEAVAGGMSQKNVNDLEGILTGDAIGPKRDLILTNAGVAIYVVGLTDSLEGGVEAVRGIVDSGAAKAKRDALRET